MTMMPKPVQQNWSSLSLLAANAKSQAVKPAKGEARGGGASKGGDAEEYAVENVPSLLARPIDVLRLGLPVYPKPLTLNLVCHTMQVIKTLFPYETNAIIAYE
jgi:hypothetical protein